MMLLILCLQDKNKPVAIKCITKKNLAKSQSLLSKEIKILKVRRFPCQCKGPATRNDIVDDIVDDPSSTMVFNVAKIASARSSSTISLTKSLRVAGP